MLQPLVNTPPWGKTITFPKLCLFSWSPSHSLNNGMQACIGYGGIWWVHCGIPHPSVFIFINISQHWFLAQGHVLESKTTFANQNVKSPVFRLINFSTPAERNRFIWLATRNVVFLAPNLMNTKFNYIMDHVMWILLAFYLGQWD